jgi:DNA-binding transcriptional MocR family regulator
MTIRLPHADQRKGPIYREIADAIAREVQAGRVKPGSRLPTQRELARQLRVTLTTVTRAYRDAERRGLISGEVGRGTFIRTAAFDSDPTAAEPGPINLGINSLMPYAHAAELADRLAAAVPRTEGIRIFDYQPHAGSRRNRAAGAAWIARTGLDASADRIVVTAGGQHAILLSLMALATPGDEVLVEEFTYAGVKDVAAHLNLRLRSLATDAAGLVPAALDKACRSRTAKILYIMPTLQNPTSAVMPEARRREIAALARKHQLKVIEDDVYGYLIPESRPLSSLLPPDAALYVTSTSKSIAPGMRVGYLLAPASLIDRVAVAVLRTIVNAPPAMAELATSIISDGLADRIVEWKRKEVAARQEIARRVLDGVRLKTHRVSPHLWLQLPEPWDADSFVTRARERGVIVNAAKEFAIVQDRPLRAIRVCLGPPRSRAALEEALRLLVRILNRPRESSELVV